MKRSDCKMKRKKRILVMVMRFLLSEGYIEADGVLYAVQSPDNFSSLKT